ncbi:hypothetical protein HGRIS_001940 [Hohenbuehelia grisea]|uniref:Uncharacterized protein n=1 Tax=Hohenbuehelia grisea TaxID=104357 RepID=A0ABR3JJZ6_9AGAR
MDSCPEPLEKIFLKVEAEREQRAKEEEEAVQQARAQHDAQDANDVPRETRSTIPAPRERRRGSISISKFGELAPGGVSDLAPSPATPTLPSIPAGKATFYQVQTTHSMDSFSSAHLGEAAKTEDDHQVTQVEQIPARQSISKAVESLLPRRLSRSRSSTVTAPLPEMNGLVIGISVEEATAEAQEDHPPVRAVAFSSAIPRGKSVKAAFSDFTMSGGNWVDRTKASIRKFRRKSTPVLKETVL